MIDQERSSLRFAIMLLISFFMIPIVVDYLLQLNIIQDHVTGIQILDKAIINFTVRSRGKLFTIRGIFILAMIALSYLQGTKFYQSGLKAQVNFILLSLLSSLIFLAGYSSWRFYNLVLYPVNFIFLFIFIPKGYHSFSRLISRGDPGLNKVNRQQEEFSFSFQTKKGLLTIHDIRTGTFIEGSAKAGKTASIIIPTIVQAARNGFAGLIYDYEGDLSEPGGGQLTHIAYTTLAQSKTPVKFALINFTDLSRTMRCNPLAPRYIKSYNHALELATVILFNINRNWSKHKDFWSDNAIAAYAATIWFFQRNFPRYSTIPHITEFLLNDFKNVLTILNTDEDIAPYIRPIIAALERDASGQIAGAESSTQFPLARMRSPEVYYVFNPDPENELDLDITNKEHPIMLCVCNAPELQNALAPSVGAIIQVCKVQMNKMGKCKSIFLFDEMPTIYIDNADKIPAEARKKQVCTFFAVQTYDQLVRDYGINNARVIRNSCGNLFTGITSVESSEMISKMMGEYKHIEYARTVGDSGHSITESIKQDKVLLASDVASQPTGHFSGRILGGKPPYFSTQFQHNKIQTLSIPHFNYPRNLNSTKSQEQILSSMVIKNYQQVTQDVKTLISKYDHLLD